MTTPPATRADDVGTVGEAGDTGTGTGTGTGTVGAPGVIGDRTGATYPNDPGERRWHYRRSLASRVTLLTTMAVGLTVAAMATGLYTFARMQLQEQQDASLLERARTAEVGGLLNNYNNIRPEISGAADAKFARILFRPPGYLIIGETDLPVGDAEIAVARHQSRQSVRTVTYQGEHFRMVTVAADEDGQALIIAQSLQDQEEFLAKLGWLTLVVGLLGMLAAGVAGWGVARNGLRPVRRLTASVETIARTERLDPLPVEGADEVARLATAFNEMLGALSASRDRQRQLVTDAGHELRTPLTSLRTNVDLLVQSDHDQVAIDPTARAELLDDIRAQTDELTTLIGDLTELARDEPLAPVVGEVDLSEIVDASVARVRRRAVDKTFDVDAQAWEVFGEAAALERAVTNLLDNAAKWGPPGSTVTIRLTAEDDVGRLVVDDQGPGIAEADRDNVFDRFWRAEESRTMPGSGLGLSIVRQVVERHSGRVSAEQAPGGGARLVVELPGRPGRLGA
ncbi:sensor histidine kinase [Nocardioides rubriscoriae]|uniref:sensor histidine kinase n=1 Tax=Nocardioides rubriscoriae TaxID=642762 RepID=UPI0011DFFE40|nr:HAMP domain-containing sensor histidine kinase [Nocardioides rubriscoriae]